MESRTASCTDVLLQQISLSASRRDYELRSSVFPKARSTSAYRAPPSHAAGRRAPQFTRAMSVNLPHSVADVSLFPADDRTPTAKSRADPSLRGSFSGPLILTRLEHEFAESDTSYGNIASVAANHKLPGAVAGGAHLQKSSPEMDVASSCRVDASSFRWMQEEQVESVQQGTREESTRHVGASGRYEDQASTALHQYPSFRKTRLQEQQLELLSQNGLPVATQQNGPRKRASTDVKSLKQASILVSTKRVDSWRLIASTSSAAPVISAEALGPELGTSNRKDNMPDHIGNKSSRQYGSDSKRRPTASIAWDNLNTPQESSPQHELAAIPFRWEEAPGKPKTSTMEQHIPAERSRMLARREGYQRNLLVKNRSSDIRDLETSTGEEHAYTSSRRLRQVQLACRSDSMSSFRSSHRFYGRTAAVCEEADRSFGSGSSMDDSRHIISEVQVEAHIDLVAPAAAKFLVESCPRISNEDIGWFSCTSESEQSETASVIPFKWEEAPGKPKLQGAGTSSLRRMQSLQLPPRLLAGSQRSHSTISRRFELDDVGQHDHQRSNKYVSMSGPLIGYYERNSNTAAPETLQQSNKSLTQSFSITRNENARRKAKGSNILGSSESPGSERWFDHGQPAETRVHDPWSPRSILQGPNGTNCQTPTASDPSSASSDRDHATTHDLSTTQTATNAVAFNMLSQSLSCASYESFEQSFTDYASPSTTTSFAPAAVAARWDHLQNASCSSTPFAGSPYLGPSITSMADYGSRSIIGGKESTSTRGGAGSSELGVRAIMKLCRTGSPWRLSKLQRHKNPSSEIWAPTLATSFQCNWNPDQSTAASPIEAEELFNQGDESLVLQQQQHQMPRENCFGKQLQVLDLVELHQDSRFPIESDTSSSSSPEVPPATRLPYTMPSQVAEQDTMCGGPYRGYCDSPDTHWTSASCLGVKLSPVKFITGLETATASWVNRGGGTVQNSPVSGTAASDGYRSPAYRATLELLSPSADLLMSKKKTKKKTNTKKKKKLAISHRIRLQLPSRHLHRRPSLIERVCNSLKRALYSRVWQCYTNNASRSHCRHDCDLPATEFSFREPN